MEHPMTLYFTHLLPWATICTLSRCSLWNIMFVWLNNFPCQIFFLGLLVDEWFLINTRTFQITFIRIFLSYIFYNLQSCFFNVKMSNKIVGSSTSMSKFYLSVSYIKYNLRRHFNTIIINFFKIVQESSVGTPTVYE